MEQKRWYFCYVAAAAITVFLCSSIILAAILLVPLAIALLLAALRVRPNMMRAFSHGYLIWILLMELKVIIIYQINVAPLVGILLTYALEIALCVFLLIRLRPPRAFAILVVLFPELALLYLLPLAAAREKTTS